MDAKGNLVWANEECDERVAFEPEMRKSSSKLESRQCISTATHLTCKGVSAIAPVGFWLVADNRALAGKGKRSRDKSKHHILNS